MRLTVHSLINQFLKWAGAALAPNTVAAYRHQLQKIPERIKKKQAISCRPIDLSTWAKTWHEAQAVVRLFNWAVEDARLIRSNPFAACRMPSRGGRRRIVGQAVLRKMMRSGRHASRRFLLALRETLARPQEIRLATWEQLQPQDVDTPIDQALADGTALIVQTDFKDRARRIDTTRPRVLLVSRRLGRAILRIAAQCEFRTGPIWTNNRGKAWTRNAVRCLMRRVRRRLDITADGRGENVVAYTFRHSLATIAASRGVTDRTLADILGHVETRTTSRYVHLSVGPLRAAMERIAPDRGKMRADRIRSL